MPKKEIHVMSGKNKLKKFADLSTFSNVFQNHDIRQPELINSNEEIVEMKGRWNKDYFKNDHPLVLELACGKGEYTVGMAQQNPAINYMGVDIKGNRIWKGATDALDLKLDNVAFLRTRIEQIELFVAPNEVDEIWITFADPFLKKGKANRRLTSPPFLDRYRKILKPGGLVHLKTDEKRLSDFTLEVIESDPATNLLYYKEDIYSEPLDFSELEIKTYYEKMHLVKGKTIKYLRFTIS